jgi:hypothetical protein
MPEAVSVDVVRLRCAFGRNQTAAWLGLTACEEDRTWNALVRVDQLYSESYGNGLDLWTPYGRRQVDIAVRNPDGNLHLYEVKVNKSNYTRGQRRKDEWLAKTYGFETSVVRRGTECPICNP